MLDRDKSFWVIEAYFLGKLHYWSGGAKGRSYENGWSLTIDFATKFFDRESADGVMVKLCDGVGRSVEHGMLSLEPLK